MIYWVIYLPSVDTCKKEIKKLEDTANMVRDMHSYQFQKYERFLKVFSLVIIVSSALVAILAIADPRLFFLGDSDVNPFRTIIAILGFIVFLFSLGDKIFEINGKVAKHEQAVKALTDFLLECRKFRNLDIESCSEEEINLKMDALNTTYSLINQMTPFAVFDDKDFIKGKKRHLEKVEISKKLSNNPHENIDEFVERRYLRRLFKWIKGLLF